jgi:branched-chain amino acid transport system substrate-binding protein
MKTPSLFLIFATAALFSACGAGEPIFVGFSGQLSGNYSDLGVGARNGVRLAIEEMNEEGGIAGRTLELLAENDLNSLEGVREADKKLVDAGVVAIIGHITSSQTLVSLEYLNELAESGAHDIALISPTASTPLLSGKRDRFFRLNPSSDRSAAAIADYARRRLKVKSVSIIYDTGNEAYSLPYIERFSKTMEKYGLEVRTRVSFRSGSQVQWTALVEELAPEKVDAVFLVSSATDTAILAGLIRKKTSDTHMLGSGWANTDALIRNGGSSVEGMVFTDTARLDEDSEAYRSFERRYRNRFGKPLNFAVLQGYESMRLLEEGLMKTSGSGRGIVEALQSIESIEGIRGRIFFDAYGDVGGGYYITRVEEGSFVAVERWDDS